MKNLRLLPLAALLTVGALTACAGGNVSGADYDIKTGDTYELKINKSLDFSKVKVGLICLHDTNSTYDKNFIDSMEEARVALGLSKEQVLVRTGIPEGSECYDTASEMVNAGCNVIFADSFGHEDYMIQAAKKFPNVQFHHATGTKAHTEKLANYHNGFASIYEGRYLAGVVAGLKLKDMKAKDPSVASKVGYIGAFTYAEVISGYTSWYLGVKSVVDDVTMDVTFTGSWYDETAEKNGALKLKEKGAVLISQHADSLGAPTACEQNGIPNVSYNGSTEDSAPKTYLVNSRINWAPYFVKMVESVSGGAAMAYDTTGNRADGSVLISDLGKKASTAETAAYVNNVKKQIADGSVKVFDTSKFTVTVKQPAGDGDFGLNTNAKVDANGHLTSYMADVDDMGDYVGETEVVANGEFQESKFRSAPYFDIQIDGINLLDTKF